ncbi:MAG: pyridoxamine 5'-phosphate oxidase family protein [Gemmatimonadota bacterium]
MSFRRPEASEYDAHYQRYIELVPDGDVVDTLDRQLDDTVRLLRAVPEEREGFRPRPDAWSVREVVAHLADTERVFAYRALSIARGDPAELPSMEQDTWTREADADTRSLQDLVDEWLAARRATVRLFRGLRPEGGTRIGTASGRPVSVRALAWTIAGHELHHRALLEERYGLQAPESADVRTALRRRDRGKEDAWIRAFLGVAPFGFLATVDDQGQPFLNSNLFVYDRERHCIYLHTARTGRTRSNLEAGARVCFSVAGMGRLLPADEALEFSVEYAGVVVFGRGEVVQGADEATRGLRLLLERYSPHLRYGEDYRSVTAEELKRTAVYRIDVESWSGKQKAAAADFPGAFDLPAVEIPFPDPPDEA